MFKYVTTSLIVLVILLLGYLIFNKYSHSGLYGSTLKSINAENVLPYKKEIKPKIAVIDTGADLENKYLQKANISQKYLDNFSQTSEQLHGTMVSGIMVGDGNGHTNPGGLIPKAEILSIQSGSDLGMSSRQLASAIKLAVSNNVDIINISLATTKDTQELKDAVKEALEKGITIVASSGNESSGDSFYPASYSGVISVGSIDENKNLMGHQNFSNIDLFAIGKDILTTTADNDKEKGLFDGSSAATPIVTSVVSILKTKYPNISSDQVKTVLIKGSDIKDYQGHKVSLLNVKKTLEVASLIETK